MADYPAPHKIARWQRIVDTLQHPKSSDDDIGEAIHEAAQEFPKLFDFYLDIAWRMYGLEK